MNRTIYCRTVGLDSRNILAIAKDITSWLDAYKPKVFVQNDPCRLVVVYNDVCTVINEGDIFSFIEREGDIDIHRMKQHFIENHTEKRKTVHVQIQENLFVIESFVFCKCGDTENMKFRLTCLNEPDLSETYDDYAGVKKRLEEFLWQSCDEVLFV